MPRDLVLITGATGFIGFRVLVRALEAGYAVRCAVRSSAGIKKILAAPSIRALNVNENRLFWTLVWDSASPGAYDGAVAGVKYVIHCAAPVPGMSDRGGGSIPPEEQDEVYVKPAVDSVVGMLRSAAEKAGGTVERVVVTSSIVGIVPLEYFSGPPDRVDDNEGKENSEKKVVFDAESRVMPLPKAPYGPGFPPYAAGKTAALDASEEWVLRSKPPFDLISVVAAWVWGRHELATSPAAVETSSNGPLVRLLAGRENPVPLNAAFVSVHDVADAHVRALDPGVAGNRAFVLAVSMAWEDAKGVARKHFGEAFDKGILSDMGAQAELRIPLDTDKTEELLGREFSGFEETVQEVMGQYVALVEGSSWSR